MIKNRLTHYQNLLTPRREFYKALVGVVQVCSGLDLESNYEKNKHYIEFCAGRGAKFVCIPENFHFMGRYYSDGIEVAEPLNGPTIKRYR